MKQPLSAKKAEIKYRSKIYKSQSEYSKKEMISVLKKRSKKVEFDFKKLTKTKFLLEPFLEIGAEYGQASLVLTNKFSLVGYATDIAQGPFNIIKKTAKKLKFKKIPETLVCDAENLPFKRNSFPFVFCYQTLHHFPDPKSVSQEVERMLSDGGTFFIGEEPVKGFNLNLWRRPTKLRWWEKILKYTIILHFISRIGKTEVQEGILEETFSLKTWKDSFKNFPNIDINLFPFPYGPTGKLIKINNKWQKINLKTKISTYMTNFLGGGISIIATKNGKLKSKYHLPSPTHSKKSKLILQKLYPNFK